MSSTVHDQLPDASRLNWVDRFAPAFLRPWLRLGRFDRPVGIWLLYLPCAMGLALGIARPVFAIDALHPDIVRPHWDTRSALVIFPWLKLVLFFIGAALMRAAGCAFNDFVDRDFDARVERTRARPIPSGQISPKQALAFIAACSLISLGILVQLGQLAILLGVASLALVAAYPFMKRITWWPQAWLGLTFNWGLLMGYATTTGHIDAPALIFYAGLVFWTLGYDTIYALQDIDDDIMIGVKSSARALGKHTVAGVSIFYGLAVLLTGAAGMLAHLPFLYFTGLLVLTGHFYWQVVALKPEDGVLALKLFKSNRTAGLIWFVSLLLVHVSGGFHV